MATTSSSLGWMSTWTLLLEILQANYHQFKDRGRLGSGDEDAKEIDMLGRKQRWSIGA